MHKKRLEYIHTCDFLTVHTAVGLPGNSETAISVMETPVHIYMYVCMYIYVCVRFGILSYI